MGMCARVCIVIVVRVCTRSLIHSLVRKLCIVKLKFIFLEKSTYRVTSNCYCNALFLFVCLFVHFSPQFLFGFHLNTSSFCTLLCLDQLIKYSIANRFRSISKKRNWCKTVEVTYMNIRKEYFYFWFVIFCPLRLSPNRLSIAERVIDKIASNLKMIWIYMTSTGAILINPNESVRRDSIKGVTMRIGSFEVLDRIIFYVK